MDSIWRSGSTASTGAAEKLWQIHPSLPSINIIHLEKRMRSVFVDDFNFFSVFLQGAFQSNDVTGELTQPGIAQAMPAGVLEVNRWPCGGLMEGVTVLNRPATRKGAGEKQGCHPPAGEAISRQQVCRAQDCQPLDPVFLVSASMASALS